MSASSTARRGTSSCRSSTGPAFCATDRPPAARPATSRCRARIRRRSAGRRSRSRRRRRRTPPPLWTRGARLRRKYSQRCRVLWPGRLVGLSSLTSSQSPEESASAIRFWASAIDSSASAGPSGSAASPPPSPFESCALASVACSVPAAARVLERRPPEKAVQASATGSARRAIASICQHTTRQQPSNVGLISWMNGGWTTTSAGRDRARVRAELLGGLLGTAKHAVPPVLRPRLGRFDTHYRPRPLAVPASYLRARPPPAAPLISIVVPSLNQGRFIGATLASIAAQRYPRLEWIVADGGSSDDTLEVLADYSDRIDRLESRPDGGPAVAINRELGRARGEILCWLNSDDLLLPGALAHVARFFVAHPRGRSRLRLPGADRRARQRYRALDDAAAHPRRAQVDRPRAPGGGVLASGPVAPAGGSRTRRSRSPSTGTSFAAPRPPARGSPGCRASSERCASTPGRSTRAHEPQSIAEQEAVRARDLDEPLTKAQTRARLLGYLLRSLPYQYAHAVRARLGVRRVPVSLPPARSAHAAQPAGAAAGPGISLASPVSPSRRKGGSG